MDVEHRLEIPTQKVFTFFKDHKLIEVEKNFLDMQKQCFFIKKGQEFKTVDRTINITQFFQFF